MARLRVGVLLCQPVTMLGGQGGGAMLEPLGRPSIMLVVKVMTTGVCTLTLVMQAVLL